MHWYSYLAYSFGKASSANRLLGGVAGLDSADRLAPDAGALILSLTLSLTLAHGFGRFHGGL